ncbi:MAG: hypothetical protein ABSD70_08615 [Terracidiphilus sp.]|jgi:hypothetical protein
MLFRLRWWVGLLVVAANLHAQIVSSPRYQLFGGYSYLSNSLNGVSGSQHSLSGYEIAFAIPPWHHLRYKMNVFQYSGKNQGAAEHPYFVMAGGQYGKGFGREYAFVEAMGGVGNVNKDWGANQTVGNTASFSALLGGGLDTPLSQHFSFRVQGDYQYAYFKQEATRNPGTGVPTYVPGLPTNFGRISTGIVWRF